MTRSKRHTDSSAREAHADILEDEKRRQREQRQRQTQLYHQATYDALPRATHRRLIHQLHQPRHNKKRIARENGLSHAFIVWLWEHHV